MRQMWKLFIINHLIRINQTVGCHSEKLSMTSQYVAYTGHTEWSYLHEKVIVTGSKTKAVIFLFDCV